MSKLPKLRSSGGMVQRHSRRIVLSLCTAALALLGARAPLAAQSAYPVNGKGELIVQNNRTVPVTVYLEGQPIERELGTVEALQTATFTLPRRAMREGSTVDLLIQPRGQLLLMARGYVMGDASHFGLVVPATPHQQKRAEKALLAADLEAVPVVTTSSTEVDQIDQD